MEKIEFKKIKNDISRFQTDYLSETMADLKKTFNDVGLNQACTYIEKYLTTAHVKDEYVVQRINDVKKLIGKYWKVSFKKSNGEISNQCYMYPYDFSVTADLMFTIVSFINIHDFKFSFRKALGEASFNYLEMTDFLPEADTVILFEEVTEQEMIDNAKEKCDELFRYRYLKVEYDKANRIMSKLVDEKLLDSLSDGTNVSD